MSKRDRELKQRLEELFSSPIEPAESAPGESARIEAEPAGPAAAPAAAPAIEVIAALTGQIDPSLWKTVLEHIPLPIYIKDRDHTWIAVNPAFCELLGQQAGTLLGHVDKEQDDEAWRLDDQVLETGQPEEVRESTVAADGTVHTRHVRRVPLSTGDTAVQYVLGIIEDTLKSSAVDAAPAHDRVELQAELAEQRQNVARFRAIVEATPIPVLITRAADGKALYVNTRAAEMFGVTQHDILYRTTPEFYDDPADRQKTLAAMQRDGRVTNYEVRLKKADGASIWVMLSSQPMTFNGEAAVLSGFYDVTDRRRAEQESMKFKLGLERSSDAVFMTGVDGKIMYVNQAFEKMYGWTREEAIGQTPRILKSGVIPPEQYKHFWETLLAKGTIAGEITNKTKDGRLIPIEGTNGPILDETGNLIGFLATHRDITERKHAEDELRRLSHAVDQSPASILITDLAGTIQYVNQKFTEVTGYTYGEVIGQNPRLFKSGETPAETYQQMWSTLLNGGEWRGELLNKKKNGELYWEDTRLSPIVDAQGHPLNFLAIKEDVTERKRLQAEVERSAQLLRTLLDNIPALVYIKNTRSEFIVANEPTARAMGAASPDELIGKTDLDFYPRDMAAQFLANEQDIIRSGQPLVAYEEAATDPNGNPAWHSSTKVPYRGHQGQIEGLVGITIDITQRKRAEQELLRFKLGMERSSDAVFVTDTSGIIQYVNPAFEKIYGYSAAEAIGQTPRIIKSGLVPQEQYAVFWQTLLSKSTVKGEIINRRKDGQHLVIEASNNPIVDESGNLVGFLGVHRDITERKQAEGERERLLATEAKRALQSQTAGEISKAAASILRPDELMPFVVELIRERFDLYYVGLFLTDPAGKWAVLRAGTGEAGRRMLDGFHRLEVGGSSMIGRCVATGQARIALDVGEEAVRFDNPLLPKTRSEMALPLISRGQTLGALTIQSSKLTAFTSDDITVLQTMADQVANAFANAQLFEQSRAARAEAEARLRELTFLQRVGQAVSSTLDLSRVLDALFTTLETEMGFTHTAVIVFDEAAGEVRTLRAGGSAAAMQNLVRPLAQMQNDIVLDVARKGKTEIVEGWDDRLDREVYEREGHADLVRAFAPLRLRDQSIGVLEVGYQRQRRAHITPEEVRLVDGMADQVAIALGNARLFEQANLRADQLAALNRVGQAFAKLAASSEILDIVDSIVGELIGNRNLYIALYDEARQTIEFPVYSIDGERRPVAGRPFGNGMTEYVLRTQAPLLIPHDVSTYAERLGIANIGRDSQCFLAVPMLAGNKALGVIAVQDYERENVYSKEQLDLLGTIASQVAIALENTRLFEQARLRAEELAALNEISRMLTARLDVQQVLNEVYRGASRLLDTANFYIALYEPERNRVSFLINSTQSVIDKEITSMPADHGLTGYIIRTRQSLLIKENVAEWQRQMGVPLVGEPAHSWLGVPLLTGDQILGVMAIQSYTPDHTYDEHDRDVMTAIASQAVIALQNARLFDQTQRNARELATLNELGRAISQQIEVNQVLEVAYQHMQELVQVDAFIVGLYDADANQVAFPVVYDEGQRYDEGVSPLNPASNVGKVILTGEQILVLETAESLAQVTKVAGALGNASRPSASLLYVPLRVGQQIIGALSVQSYQLNAYTEDHVRLVGAVASQLAAALQNVRLFEETRQRNAELATLNQIISSANQTLDLRAMLDTVLRQTLKSFGFDGGLITVYNENRRKLERIVRVGLPGEIPADPAEGLENSLCTYVFDSMKPLVIEDFRQGAPIDVSGEIEAGYYSYIGIPLEAKGRMLGTWCGFRKSAGPFGKNTLALLQVIGRQAGFAIENARLFDETQRDAQREQALREITARVRGSIDPDTIVRTAVRELGVALGRQTFVRLGSQEELMQPPAGSGAVSDSGNGHDRGEEPQGGK